MPWKRRKNEHHPHTPTYVIEKDLADSRLENNVYLTANIVRELRQRGKNVSLTKEEQKMLIGWLRRARHGKKPLAMWLPRGYQVVRLLCVLKILNPRRKIIASTSDKRLFSLAEAHYTKRMKTGDIHASAQLQSLYHSLRFLGLR